MLKAAKQSPEIRGAAFTAELKRTDLLSPSVRKLKPRQIVMPDLKHTEKGAVPMLPRYFHYIEPTDPLNSVLDRFMHGKPLTEADRSLLKKHAAEKNPADDRVRRVARASLALATDRKTTYDYPLTQSLRRLRLRVTRESRTAGRTGDRGSEVTR